MIASAPKFPMTLLLYTQKLIRQQWKLFSTASIKLQPATSVAQCWLRGSMAWRLEGTLSLQQEAATGIWKLDIQRPEISGCNRNIFKKHELKSPRELFTTSERFQRLGISMNVCLGWLGRYIDSLLSAAGGSQQESIHMGGTEAAGAAKPTEAAKDIARDPVSLLNQANQMPNMDI